MKYDPAKGVSVCLMARAHLLEQQFDFYVVAVD